MGNSAEKGQYFRQRLLASTNALDALFGRTSRPCTTPLGSPYGGERSEVAVVNDGPVDRQSRDRGAPQRAGRPNGLTERVLTPLFQTSVS